MDLEELWFSRKGVTMRTKVLATKAVLQRRTPKRLPFCSSQPFQHQCPLVLLWQVSLEGTKDSDGKYSLIDSLGPRKHPIQLEINNLCHRTLRLGHYWSRSRKGWQLFLLSVLWNLNWDDDPSAVAGSGRGPPVWDEPSEVSTQRRSKYFYSWILSLWPPGVP